jgi:hypothetical protein
VAAPRGSRRGDRYPFVVRRSQAGHVELGRARH